MKASKCPGRSRTATSGALMRSWLIVAYLATANVRDKVAVVVRELARAWHAVMVQVRALVLRFGLTSDFPEYHL
jgi:hypothetical protein